ncbi:retrovirus-related pol polyprotein from transposon TNT 1-94 [Tanacetum coccineum]
MRYKARLMAQGFSQRPGIDYEETYSHVVYATTSRYLIIQERIDWRLMDVVITYLYGSLDTEIYMKLLEGFKMPESSEKNSREHEYLWKEGYKNDSIFPTLGELLKALECLKKEFEMKDFEKTKFCLGLQIEHLNDGILVHQEAYMEKVL